MTSYKKRRNRTNKKKSKKGSGLNIFNRQPNTTTESELIRLTHDVGHIKIKHFEEIIKNNLSKLLILRENCKNNCKENICTTHKNDVEFCNQINTMIQNNPDYDWSNLCANSANVIDCKNFLRSLKEIEFYINYIKSLSNKTQQLFENYKMQIKEESTIIPDANLHSE